MPDYTVNLGVDNKSVPYKIHSRNELTEAQLNSITPNIPPSVIRNARPYTYDSPDGPILFGPATGEHPGNAFLFRQFYQENVGDPISRGIDRVTETAKSSPFIKGFIGNLSEPQPEVGLSPYPGQFSSEEKQQIGGNLLSLGKGLAQSYVDDPAAIATDITGLALGASGVGTVASPLMLAKSTRLKRLAQLVLPGLTTGAVQGVAEIALNPGTTTADAVNKGLNTAGLITGMNLLFNFAPSVLKNLRQRVDEATSIRIEKEIQRTLGEGVGLSSNPNKTIEQVGNRISKLSEDALMSRVDVLSNAIKGTQGNAQAEAFRERVISLKDRYIQLSKIPITSDAGLKLRRDIYTDLQATQRIALQNVDDLTIRTAMQDRNVVAQMVRNGQLDDEGVKALNSLLYGTNRQIRADTINLEANRPKVSLPGSINVSTPRNSRIPLEITPGGTVQSVAEAKLFNIFREAIQQGEGVLGKIRTIQYANNLRNWAENIKPLMEDIQELSRYQEIVSRISKAGPDTMAIRKALADIPDNLVTDDVQKLTEAVFNVGLNDIKRGTVGTTGIPLAIPGIGRTRLFSGGDYSPSTGVNKFLPGSSGAVNAGTVRLLNFMGSEQEKAQSK